MLLLPSRARVADSIGNSANELGYLANGDRIREISALN